MSIKEIPGSKGFFASVDGVITDKKGRMRNQYMNGDGYKTASILKSNGRWQTYGVHRLVALAHIPHTESVDECDVNHIDGDVTKNTTSNLEWISTAGNNIHAALLRGSKERPAIIARNSDGRYEFIANMLVVSKRFQCDVSFIWDLIRNKKTYNGWSFQHYGKKSRIPKELHKEYFLARPGGLVPRRPVSILNIETQEVQQFISLHEAAVFFQTTPSHVCVCVSVNGKKRLFKRKYLVVDLGNPFPSLSQEEYEDLSGSSGKSVAAFNVKTQSLIVYSSAACFIKENNLSKKAVTVNLKKNRIRLKSDWVFLYFTKENVKRLQAFMLCPAA